MPVTNDVLTEKLREELSEYFKTHNLIDLAYEKKLLPIHDNLPSKVGYQIDFRNLEIVRPHWTYDEGEKEYIMNYGIWEISPIKILDMYNSSKANRHSKLNGRFGKVRLKVVYDLNSGDPIINFIEKDFNLNISN